MSPTGLRTHAVDVSGAPVAYHAAPGAGTPIVLVHGIGCDALGWEPILPDLLATGRPVIAVDLPGHGQSAPNAGHQGLDALAGAVLAAMDAAGAPQAHLVGHSLGGGLSMLVADRTPDRVASLTLVASGGLGPEVNVLLRAGHLPGAHLGLRLAMTAPAVALVRRAAEALGAIGAHPYELSENVLRLFEGLTDPRTQEAFMETLHDAVSLAGQKRVALDRLREFDGDRVCFLWCSDDPVLPVEHGFAAHAALPGSSLHVFAGHSHEPYADDPSRFAELVIEHTHQADLRRCEPGRERRGILLPGAPAARTAAGAHQGAGERVADPEPVTPRR